MVIPSVFLCAMVNISVSDVMKRVVLLLAVLSLSISCSLQIADDRADWTFMVYMGGDNTLSDFVYADYAEMQEGLYEALQHDPEITGKLHIIVCMDTLDEQAHSIYRVTPDDDPDELSLYYDMVYSMNEPNTGSAETLKDFIEFSKDSYPAEHYGLILWNHGGGVRSLDQRDICVDESSDDDIIYTSEISDTLDASHRVDFLGMDACFMGVLEVAYEYRPGEDRFGADAICFSPASEQGDGWDYERLIGRFAAGGSFDDEGDPRLDPALMSASDVAEAAVKEYEDFCSGLWKSYRMYQTQTAVDLQVVEELKTAVDAFAQQLWKYPEAAGDARAASTWYDNYGDNVDLSNVAKYIETDDHGDASLTAAAADLTAALDTAVISSYGDEAYEGYFTPGCSGLGLMLPASWLAEGQDRYYYTGLSHEELLSWAADQELEELDGYGGIDFCTANENGSVESWFEMLQQWYNPDRDESIHPGPMW